MQFKIFRSCSVIKNRSFKDFSLVAIQKKIQLYLFMMITYDNDDDDNDDDDDDDDDGGGGDNV